MSPTERPESRPVTPAGSLGESTVTLAEHPSSSVCGRLMTFTASVSAVPPAAGTPSGAVTFVADGGPATSVALHDGVATFTTPLGAGAHTVTARYPGDDCFRGAPLASLTTWIWRAGFPEPRPRGGPDPRPAPVPQGARHG